LVSSVIFKHPFQPFIRHHEFAPTTFLSIACTDIFSFVHESSRSSSVALTAAGCLHARLETAHCNSTAAQPSINELNLTTSTLKHVSIFSHLPLHRNQHIHLARIFPEQHSAPHNLAQQRSTTYRNTTRYKIRHAKAKKPFQWRNNAHVWASSRGIYPEARN